MNSLYSIERLTRLEVEVSELKKSFEEHKEEVKQDLQTINNKLDDVLALRNKGAGIFWFITIILGSAGITGMLQLFHHVAGR